MVLAAMYLKVPEPVGVKTGIGSESFGLCKSLCTKQFNN